MTLTVGEGLILASLLLAVVAAVFDWRRGIVPNWVTLGLLPVAPVLHAWGLRGSHGPFGLPGPLFGALLSLAGALLCALVPYLMFRLGYVGGADVKLLATLGALLTPHYGLQAELCALILAAILVPARLAYRGRLLRASWSVAAAIVRVPLQASRRLPLPALPEGALETLRFSPFVLAGTAAVLLFSILAPRVTP